MADDDLHHNIDNLRHSLALVGRDIEDLTRRERVSTRGRLSLLHIHAVVATCVGTGLVANGPDGIATPAYAGVRLVPGAPLTVGAVLVVCGLILGVAAWRRHVRWEMFAVASMIGWYLIFATSFAYAAIIWQFDPVGQKPSWQGMFSYYGWAAILTAHLVILRKVRVNRTRIRVRT